MNARFDILIDLTLEEKFPLKYMLTFRANIKSVDSPLKKVFMI